MTPPLPALRAGRSLAIGAHLSTLRAEAWKEMDEQMALVRESGDLADSATAAWIHELAATIVQLGKLEVLAQERTAADV